MGLLKREDCDLCLKPKGFKESVPRSSVPPLWEGRSGRTFQKNFLDLM